MDSDDLRDRLEHWQAAGLIDAGTADRIRAYEQVPSRPDADAVAPPSGQAARVGPAGVSAAGASAAGASAAGASAAGASAGAAAASFFGPALSVAELFGYLGAIFLLAAWHVFLNTRSDPFGTSDPASQLIQFGVPVAALFVVGVVLRTRGAALSRAAGVAFLVSVWYVATGVYTVLNAALPDAQYQALLTVAGASGALAALAARRLHPAVLTQVGLITTLLLLAGAALSLINETFFPTPEFDFNETPTSDSVTELVRVVGTATWWLAWAAGLGAVAWFEASSAARARAEGDPAASEAAGRRAGLTRFFAGLVAVTGTASAMTQSNGDGRVVPAWLGDLVVLAVALGLLALAIRRTSSAYLIPAAIGIIAALTDANAQYVASNVGTATALLLEGLILLAAGGVAVLARRRFGVGSSIRLDTGSATG
jgi:hypothetical protein